MTNEDSSNKTSYSNQAQKVSHVSAHSLPPGRMGALPVWSPNGKYFAYRFNGSQFTIGTPSPFTYHKLKLPNGRHMVSITNHSVIVTSSNSNRDWIYPLKGDKLGSPTPWKAPTDTWQDWVTTIAGPAILTGGYNGQTLSVTESNGKSTPLQGGEAFVSTDAKLGAVLARNRAKRLVHPRGDEADPTQLQPNLSTAPIVIWNFDAKRGPRKTSVLHLPSVSKKAGEIQDIRFSPNDQFVAILITSNSSRGPQLDGKTFIYNLRTDKRVATAPYGNGIGWAANSQALWIGTAFPEGQGTERIVNLKGQTVQHWKDKI